MKSFIFFATLFYSLNSFAQKSKSLDVCRVSNCIISGTVFYDENNNPKDTMYHMLAKDDRYQQLISFISIHIGDANNLYSFLKYCSNFLEKEEKGVSEKFDGNFISIEKLYGGKTLNIHGIRNNTSGYHSYNANSLSKLLTGFKKWSDKNNVVLD